MASKYWIKLYHEILHDRKMACLRDRLWRRAIECFLMAGDAEENGFLPTLDDMAWTLRLEAEVLESELVELANVGILEQREGRWFVSKFSERQSAVKGAERMARLRERRKREKYYANDTDGVRSSDEGVTIRHTDTDIDIDKETDTERGCGALVRAYCDAVEIPMPDLADRRAMTNWLEPESTLLAIVGGDEAEAKTLITATLAYMREHRLSYKNLASLVNVARTVWSIRQQQNGFDPWDLIDRAWKKGDGRVLLEDARVFEAVERMGGWVRFKSAKEKDIPFLQKEFKRAYDATAVA